MSTWLDDSIQFLVKHQSDVAVKVCFRCDYLLNQETLSKAEYSPWCGWASSNQLKALREKTEVPKEERSFTSRCLLTQTATSNCAQALLQISDLLDPTIVWANILKSIFTYVCTYIASVFPRTLIHHYML